MFGGNAARGRFRRARRAAILALAATLLSACGGLEAGRVPTVQPTRTLIPPTATPTPTPSAVTPTPTDLPSPATLVAAATADAAHRSPVEAMIAATTADLVASGVAPADIRLLSVDGFAWQDATWGCAARQGTAADDLSGDTTAGYRIAYSAGERVYVYHTDLEATFFLCDDRGWLARDGAPILVDPIASAMVALCRADAARRLGIAQEALQLASLITVTWPDESVGCPQAGVDYSQQETPGFRIVLRAGEDALIYHTSARHVVPCRPDQAILPEPIRQALARESE
jgi:hypothetical protein